MRSYPAIQLIWPWRLNKAGGFIAKEPARLFHYAVARFVRGAQQSVERSCVGSGIGGRTVGSVSFPLLAEISIDLPSLAGPVCDLWVREMGLRTCRCLTEVALRLSYIYIYKSRTSA